MIFHVLCENAGLYYLQEFFILELSNIETYYEAKLTVHEEEIVKLAQPEFDTTISDDCVLAIPATVTTASSPDLDMLSVLTGDPSIEEMKKDNDSLLQFETDMTDVAEAEKGHEVTDSIEVCFFLILQKNVFYIHVKKVGILAIGCRLQGAKPVANQQKMTYYYY